MGTTHVEMRNETLAAFAPKQRASYERIVQWLKGSGVFDESLRTGARPA